MQCLPLLNTVKKSIFIIQLSKSALEKKKIRTAILYLSDNHKNIKQILIFIKEKLMDFGKNFVWGAATASYQVEGGDLRGTAKGLNIFSDTGQN